MPNQLSFAQKVVQLKQQATGGAWKARHLWISGLYARRMHWRRMQAVTFRCIRRRTGSVYLRSSSVSDRPSELHLHNDATD